MKMIESLASCSWYLLLVGVVSVTLQSCVSVFAARLRGFVQIWCGAEFPTCGGRSFFRWGASKLSIITFHCGSTTTQSKGYFRTRLRNQRGHVAHLGEVVCSLLKSLPCTEISVAA